MPHTITARKIKRDLIKDGRIALPNKPKNAFGWFKYLHPNSLLRETRLHPTKGWKTRRITT